MISTATEAHKPRIPLWGDSLTEGKPGASYTSHLAELMPEYRMSNRGRGGDTVKSLLWRLESEPLPPLNSRAQAVVLWIGVNDVYSDLSPGHSLWKTAMRQPPTRDSGQFDRTFGKIVETLISHGRNILVLPPLFVGEDPRSELNSRLKSMGDRIGKICNSNSATEFLDIRPHLPLDDTDPPRFLPVNPWQKLTESVVGMDESFYDRAAERRRLTWTYDGVHLNSRGARSVAGFLATELRRIMKDASCD